MSSAPRRWRATDLGRSATWVTALGGSAAVLAWAGTALPAPPLDPIGWRWWLADVGPATAALSLARLVALVVVAYLALVLVAHVAAAATGCRPALRLARWCTVPALRRALAGVATVGLALPVASPAGAQPGPEVAVMVSLPGPDPTTTAPTTTTEPTATTTPPGRATAPPAPAPPPGPAPAHPSHTIAPGEHLWAVSGAVLARAWGRTPTDAEVLAYLHRLVAANAHVLAVPDHPDLVFPGQVFALPPT